MWPFIKYDKNAEVIKAEYLRSVFLNLGFKIVNLRDENYLLLSRKGMRALVQNYRDTGYFLYKKDFPDCDDFALWTKSDVGKGAAIEQLQFHPVFSYAKVRLKSGIENHGLNIALVKDKGSIYTDTDVFHPQNNRWGKWDEIEEKHEIEI